MRFHELRAAVLAALGCCVMAANVAVAESPHINIPAGSLINALEVLGKQLGVELVYRPELVKDLRTPGLQGNISAEDAVKKLIEGTPLSVRKDASGVLIISQSNSSSARSSLSRYAETQPASVEKLEEVVVTGKGTLELLSFGKEAQTLRNIPQSVSILTRQRMDEQNITTLTQALNSVVGVYGHDPGTGASSMSGYSRGNYMAEQYDGVPGVFYLTSGNTLFDLAIYERIEVLRGPAGLLQGAGEPGGAINLARKRPQHEFAGNASVTAGSWNNFHGDVDITGPLNESGSVRARGVLVATDRDYFYDAADKSAKTGYGIVEFDLGTATTMALSVALQDTDFTPYFGQPLAIDGAGNYSFLGLPRSTNVNLDWNVGERTAREVVFDVEHRFAGDWKAKLRAYQSRVKGVDRYGFPFGPVDAATDQAAFFLTATDFEIDNAGADLNLSGSFELFGQRHQLLLGVNTGGFTWDNYYGSAFLVNRDLLAPGIDASAAPQTPDALGVRVEQSGLYGVARIKLAEPLTLVMGGRVDDYSFETRTVAPTPTPWQETSSAHRHFTPYGGLVWDFSRDFSFYGSYTEIFKPQSQFDYLGNVLEPRIGSQIEVGVKGEHFGGRLSTSLAVFRLRDSNRATVDPDPTHIGCGTIGTDSCFLPAGVVETEGWEVEIVGRLAPGWDLTAGFTDYEQTDKQTGGVYEAWLPTRSFKLWSNYHFNGSFLNGALRNWNLGLGVNSQNRTSLTSGSPARPYFSQGGYTVASVQAGYRFSDNLQATLTVNNVTDRRYYSSLFSTAFINMYGEPRSALLAVRVKF